MNDYPCDIEQDTQLSYHLLPALASGAPWQPTQIFLEVQLHDCLNNAYDACTDHLLEIFVLEDRQNRTDFFDQPGLVFFFCEICTCQFVGFYAEQDNAEIAIDLNSLLEQRSQLYVGDDILGQFLHLPIEVLQFTLHGLRVVLALVQPLRVLQLKVTFLDFVVEGAFDPIRWVFEERQPFLERRDEAVQAFVVHEWDLQFGPRTDLILYSRVGQIILYVEDLIQNLAIFLDQFKPSQHHISLEFFNLLLSHITNIYLPQFHLLLGQHLSPLIFLLYQAHYFPQCTPIKITPFLQHLPQFPRLNQVRQIIMMVIRKGFVDLDLQSHSLRPWHFLEYIKHS